MRTLDFIPNTSLKLIQSKNHFRMTSDSVILSEFMQIRSRDKVLDIGTNNGVLLLVVGLKSKERCVGIDIHEEAIEIAKENAELNHLPHLSFEHSSVQNFMSDTFDVCICNPPYHAYAQSHKDDPANHDVYLSLEDLAIHSYRLLKDKGRLVMILKTPRVYECIDVMNQHALKLKRLQSIHHSLKHSASSVCLEFVKNGKDELKIEAPIFHHIEK